ncbi:MAG: MATE family efflux transporter [Lachnospiraceae bacterium]
MKSETKEQQYIRMTTTPVGKLIITLGIPTTISMLVTNIYNLVDTYFVSTLGNSASGAVGVVFALMGLIQAFGFTFGMGSGSILSRKLGKGNVEGARVTASTGFTMAFLCGVCILFLGLIFISPLMILLGSTETILPFATEYAKFILIAAPAMTCSCVLNNVLRYEGKAMFSMFGLVTGAILNILGDFIFMEILEMGIAGAGLSTMLSQYVSVAVLLMPFLKKQVQTRIRFSLISRNGKDYLEILSVGFPSLLRQGLTSISTMSLNWCAAPFGDAAIAAMSIVSRVMNFLFCIAIGIGQGFQPVSAFNYGAEKYDRVKKAFKFMLLFSMSVMLITGSIGFIFAEPIVRQFRDDPEVVAIGVRALRITVPALFILPISTAGNMLCQSIGKAKQASFLASTRSGLFYIPVMIIASRLAGLAGIQMSQIIADTLAVCVTIPILFQVFREFPQR